MIVGLAYLGLPGFSGFVAEMNIFVGAFQHDDLFHRVTTIIVISGIVVTAVFLLRVMGIIHMGQVKNPHYLTLPTATWYEKTGIVLLIIPIVGIGVAPLWLSDMILESLQPFIQGIL